MLKRDDETYGENGAQHRNLGDPDELKGRQ
jgi:hypothetical protein